MGRFFTTGKLALKVGVQEHHIRYLSKRNRIPFAQAGKYRLYAESDLEQIRAACIKAGYLPADTTTPTKETARVG